jgi:hypothetical protein
MATVAPALIPAMMSGSRSSITTDTSRTTDGPSAHRDGYPSSPRIPRTILHSPRRHNNPVTQPQYSAGGHRKAVTCEFFQRIAPESCTDAEISDLQSSNEFVPTGPAKAAPIRPDDPIPPIPFGSPIARYTSGYQI